RRPPPDPSRLRRFLTATLLFAMFFSISKSVEWLAEPAAWVAPLLVLALLLRRRPRIAAPLAVLAVLLPVIFAIPVVASAFERWVQGSVTDSVRPGIQYDVAIVLSGRPEERIPPAAALVRDGHARAVLYSGAIDSWERLAVTLRSLGV